VFWHETDSGVVNATFVFGGELTFELPLSCEINQCNKRTLYNFKPATSPFIWAGTVQSEYVPRPMSVTLIRRHEHKQCVQDAKCTDNCNGHGTCVSPEICFCRAAFTGPTCNETVPTPPPAPAVPPTPIDALPRPPLVRRAEYDSDRRCVDGTRDADFDGVTSCAERRVTGDSMRAVAAPLYQGRGWPLDSQLFVPTTAFASGVAAVDTYMLPPDAYFFADDAGEGIDPPVTPMPTPAPTGTPMPTPILVNVTAPVDALAGVPLDSAERKLLSAILAVRISSQATAPIGVIRNTVSEYSVCLRLLETNKPPPPTQPPTSSTSTTSTTMPPSTVPPSDVPSPVPVDPPVEFAPPARGAPPLDVYTCIAQLVCVAGAPPAPAPTATPSTSVSGPAPTPMSMVTCSSLTSLTCESASSAGCQYDAINGVCVKARRRQEPSTSSMMTLAANTTAPPVTPAPPVVAPPSDLAPPMVIENIGRTNCSWQCVGDMFRGTVYAVHGLRLPYDSVCSKVKTVNTMFVVLRLEPEVGVPTVTGLSGGAIAGIVIGTLAGVILIGAGAYWFFVLRPNSSGGGGGGNNNSQQMNNFNHNQQQQHNNNHNGLPNRSPSLMNVTPSSDVQIGMYGSTRSLFSAQSSAMSSGGGSSAGAPPAVPNAFKPKFSGPTSPQLIAKIENDSSYAPVPPGFNASSRGTVVATYGPAADAAAPYGDMVLRNNTFSDGKIYGV
jgi:hypothetical protein